MKKTWMLDTNICSFIMREQPAAVLKRLEQAVLRGDRIVHEADGHAGFAAHDVFDTTPPAVRVLRDVAMQRLHVGERTVFAEQLRECRENQVAGPGRRRVAHHDLAFELRPDEILPAARRLDTKAANLLRVVGDAKRTGIQADGTERATLCLGLRPGEQVVELLRAVLDGQSLFRCLQVWIAGAAEPHVGARVVALGEQHRQLGRACQGCEWAVISRPWW